MLKRYRNQEGRGTDGFGYISVSLEGYISEVVRAVDEKEIIKALNNENASAILLHHRYPTSLPNYYGATHPLVIKHESFKYDYYVVHNGVIQNWKSMWEDYAKEGFKFMTEMIEGTFHQFVNLKEGYNLDEKRTVNDSEAFAIDICKNIEGQTTMVRSSGTAAFIALQCTKDGKVVAVCYGTNGGNPLVKEDDKALFCLKSLGQGVDVKTGVIFIRNWETGETEELAVNGFSHYGANRAGFGQRGSKDSKRESTPDYRDRGHDSSRKSEGKSDLDRTLEKMLPASQLLETDRGNSLDLEDTNWGRGILNERRQVKLWGDEELPTIEFEDFGFSEQELADEIKAAGVNSPEDAQQITELKNDLVHAIDDENDARAELNAAKSLMKSCVTNNEPLEELEQAKGLLDIALAAYDEAHKHTRATEAELNAWVGRD